MTFAPKSPVCLFLQLYPEYPEREGFLRRAVQVTGRAGDMMLFPGIMQHAAMPNRSREARTGVIIQVSVTSGSVAWILDIYDALLISTPLISVEF